MTYRMKSNRLRKALLMLACSSVGAAAFYPSATRAAQPAMTRTAVGEVAEEDKATDSQGEILVTAQRRVQSIQDVPIALQAYGQEELRRRGVIQADDIIRLAPNLSLNESNSINTSITIRGVGTNNFHGNVNRAVGIYQDDVYLATTYTGVLGVYDLDRVEVLRGPQSTLLGRNTTGGAVRYLSNKPKPGDPLSGYLDVTYGSYNRADAEGALGGSLTDTLATRGAFQIERRDGLFTNVAPGREGEQLGRRERYSGRLQFVWQPAPGTDILLNGHFGLNRGNDVGVKARGLRNPANPTQACPDVATSGNFERGNDCVTITGFNPSTSNYDQIYNTTSARSNVDVGGGFIKLDQELGFATLTAIGSYDQTGVQLADDFAGFNTFQFQTQQDSTFKDYAAEIRLTSPQRYGFRWIAGAGYFHEDLVQGTIVRRDNGGALQPGGETISFNILNQKDEDLSVYGQGDFDLTHRLTVTAGLRFTNNSKSATSRFGVANSPASQIPVNTFISRDIALALTNGAPETCPPGPVVVGPDGRVTGGPPPCLLPLLNPRQEINRLSARAAISYKFSDAILGYASYSRGFKAGGFDTRALAAFSGGGRNPVAPETLNAYEAGVKSDVLGRLLRLNAAVFYYDLQGLQTFAVQNGTPAFINIPKSRLIGLELTADVNPGGGWHLHGDFGWLDTKITDSGGIAGLDKGHVLPNSPRTSANAVIAREFRLNDGSRFNLQGAVRYVARSIDSLRFRDDFLLTKNAQFYLDLRAAYQFGRDNRYELAVFGDNLTSQKVCADIDINDNPLQPSPSDLTSTVACTPSDGRALFGGSFKVRL